ncbi:MULTISPECIES: DNA adenine methylase [unclassified Beijerinckia]|uniref:DNA adenine methylase n=1 Tax=unclassified Beijerinckia TaxID=2638183 RepID=UPI0008961F89|nr:MULTISPECIES: DNA adenine methylase [unclassified Beijerinckia]MDH7798418.1 adenine-specific DNA-methyltransferase [Beijerinckia sp. GAS462]SED20196.1 D12 class N6 adenine-specific DNA methyltransferase [Beijerinckia sp. 28-YEA-48]
MNKPQLRLPIDDNEPIAEVWRPIHYLGSKLRLVEPLRLAFDQVDPNRGRLVDLFSGSGTVSAAAAATRDVISIDIQEYSRVLCSAILLPATIAEKTAREFIARVDEQAIGTQAAAAPLIEYEEACLAQAQRGDHEPICELIEHASMVAFVASGRPAVRPDFEHAQKWTRKLIDVESRTTLVLRFYGGLFFSYRQATHLDALLTIAHVAKGAERDLLLAAIISTASEIVNTVGKHFAQPIKPRNSEGKPKRNLIAKIVRDRSIDVFELFGLWLNRYRSLPKATRKHQVIRRDYADALAQITGEVGVVYADPPYTRDHYSRFYHVLETMCLWDNPGVSTTRIRALTETFSRGMYRADRHQSPFCIKSKAPVAFEKLCAGVQALKAPLVLSYSPYASDSDAHPRVMTVDQIMTLASRYFESVETISTGKFSHMKLNATRLHIDASTEAEMLFLCR